MSWCRPSSTFTPLWVALGSNCFWEDDTKKPRFAAAKRGLVLCVCRNLFLFHHGSDFLGLHGVDVAIGIAEVEGTVVAATHGNKPLH